MKIFSERLKYERINNKISQKEFAQKLGIPRTTYAHYENLDEKDQREPPFEIVCKIAEILGVSTDYLFGMED